MKKSMRMMELERHDTKKPRKYFCCYFSNNSHFVNCNVNNPPNCYTQGECRMSTALVCLQRESVGCLLHWSVSRESVGCLLH